jgi:hypothetical protein
MDPAAAMAGCFCFLFIFGIMLTIWILFLLTLQRTLTKIHPNNREIEPGLVWLLLIPVFNWFWAVYVVLMLAKSLRNEFEYREMGTGTESFGRTIGLVWTVGNLATIPVGCGMGIVDEMMQDKALSRLLDALNGGLSLLFLVLWIVYWVQIAGYGRRLEDSQSRSRYRVEDSEEDEHGDRRRPDEYREPRSDDGEEFRGRDGFNRPQRPIGDDDPDDLDRRAEDRE